MIETVEGTERYLVTRRIVPAGSANIYEGLPNGLKETISEVHYVDGADPENKGKIGTYGIDLDPSWAEQVKTATNLIDLVNISRHGMGRIAQDDADDINPEESLEQVLEARGAPSVEAVTPKMWRAGPVLDQGAEGACVGFGCRHFVNGEPVMTDPASGMGARDIYKRAQQIDPWEGDNYSGTSVDAGLRVLVEQGYVKSVGWTKDYDSMARWLSTQGGLVIGWDWFEGMHQVNANGYIAPTGRQTGGHCVWLNELFANGDIGGENSWGRDWGLGGFFKISAEHVRWLMGRQYNVAGAVIQVGDVQPDPKPEPSGRRKVYYSKMDNISPEQLKSSVFDGVTRRGEKLGSWTGIKVGG